MNSISGAPAERNVPGDLPFAPLEREELFSGRAFYKHLAPNGAKAKTFWCTCKLNLRFLTLLFDRFSQGRSRK
jgi:hypothetical protein